MSLDPETRQQILELIYDLLPEAEAAELRRRIDADPELARAYAETQEAAELFATASRLHTAKIPMKRPERIMSTRSNTPSTPKVSKPNGAVRSPWARGANWAVGLAASFLLMVSLGGYFYHGEQLREIAAEHMRLRVTGPATLQAGVAADYVITTTAITGSPMAAAVEFALYTPGGEELFGHNETTDAEGRLRVSISSDKRLPARAVLKVAAQPTEDCERQQVETTLAVEPARYATQLSLDKPLYQPGETVYYRSLTLSRSALAADGELPIQFEILDPAGGVVAGSMLKGVTQHGVGNGAFTIGGELAGGEYVLSVRSLSNAFAETKRPFFIRRYRLPRLKKELELTRDSYGPGDSVVADFLARRAEGGPVAAARLQITATVDGKTVFEQAAEADDSGARQIKFELPKEIECGDGHLRVSVDDGGNQETIVKTIPINLGKVEVTFYPEGGDLVVGLENRVYFVARDPLGEPVHIEGAIVGGSGTKVAEVQTVHEGMGSFSFVPSAEESYRLEITSPAGVTDQGELPPVVPERTIVLSTGTGVFEAGEPLEFNLRSAKADVPLVVAAVCRGALVGHQALATRTDDEREHGVNPVVIPLAAEVGGVLRLTVYDYSTSPPEPVAERLVYRRPQQRLKVRTVAADRRYSPGEKVEMSLDVTDEKGEPVPAVLGVAVVDDALLNLADDDTPSMPTHFLLTGEIEKPADLEEADFYLSDDPEAAVALDLLLGTQGWRRFAQKTIEQLREELKDEFRGDDRVVMLTEVVGSTNPPAMFDNLEKIRGKYETSLAAFQAQRSQALDTLTTVSIFGGLGLMLLVAMLGLLKIVSGIHLWVPAVGVTVCCLLIGNPALLTPDMTVAVAFAPFNLAPPEDASERVSDQRDLGEEDRKKQPLEERLNVELEDFGIDAAPVEIDELVEAVKLRVPPGGVPELEVQGVIILDGKDLAKMLPMAELPVPGQFAADKEDEDSRPGPGEDRKLQQLRFTVRQYAHVHRKSESGERIDFAETLFWHPLLIADAEGKASIAFELSDSITTYRLQVDAHGNGRIGTGQGEVISRIPFNLEPKLPLEVTAGDRIDLPLAVVNDTQSGLPVELTVEHGELITLDGPADRKLDLGPQQRRREYFVLNVTGEKGDGELTFRGKAGKLADAVKRPLLVVPPGFPKKLSYSGEIAGPREVAVELPDAWVPGSLEVTLHVFPSTLADLQQGMDSILREPNGCFEQASTSNYPNVLTLQYMQEHDVANPTVTRRAKELLKKGYAKLAGYECKNQGYEWFGGDPGHEALTAYGLMEFRDMAEVYDVDEAMLQRTAEWLLDRRDGQGSFKRNAKALDSFGRAPEEITNAYITWALSESAQKGIEAEVKHVAQLAAASDDPYLIALAVAASLNAEQGEGAEGLLNKLAEAQADDGHLEGKQGSITRSGGLSLKVETTALAALAWLKSPAFTAQANRAIEWIIKARQGSGSFGSTQGTILALKALVEHSKVNRKTVASGKLIVRRDDLTIGEHAFEAGRQETIVIDSLEANLTPGENSLVVELTGENRMPYALDVAFRTLKGDSDENCPVRLTTSLQKPQVKASETVTLSAELTNTSDQGQPMTVAILGLPAGLEVRADQLQQIKKAGTIDYYETRAREVICYWRSLAPKQKVHVKLDLVAAVPGKYTGPASRAYLYYTAEQKQWADPLQVEITRGSE